MRKRDIIKLRAALVAAGLMLTGWTAMGVMVMDPMVIGPLLIGPAAIELGAAQPAMAQEADKTDLRAPDLSALVQACRNDYQRFCSSQQPGNGAVLACLRQHADELSATCRAAAQQERAQLPPAQGKPGVQGKPGTQGKQVAQSKSGAIKPADSSAVTEKLPAGTQITRDLAYGADPKQRFDIYLPANVMTGAASGAPILVMVHGGAWAVGDKASPQVAGNKAAYWLGKGYVFVSVNNRLLPSADPFMQATDIAQALAAIQADAPSWHGDPQRIVLMGHSSGAHLVALLTADPGLAPGIGLKPWLGTISLDSAALDVEAIMTGRHYPFYDTAFGTDKAAWRKVSPIDRLKPGIVPLPMLLVCSSQRRESCNDAQAFADQVSAHQGHATVLPEDLSHNQINDKLGLPGAYTKSVEGFMQSLGLP